MGNTIYAHNTHERFPPPTIYRRHRMNENVAAKPKTLANRDSWCSCYELYATRISVAPSLIYKLHAVGELAFGSRRKKKNGK